MVCSGIYHVNFYMQINFDLKKVKVTQLCPTFCTPMDSTVHGILQARIQERVAISFSRGSSQPRDGTQDSCIGRRILYLRVNLGSGFIDFSLIICQNKILDIRVFPVYREIIDVDHCISLRHTAWWLDLHILWNDDHYIFS